MRLNAKQLRANTKKIERSPTDKNDVYIVLDNVLDTYNVGSVFRLADGAGVKKIYLCGGTEFPPNPRIKKASINTTEVVDWEYLETAQEAISKIRELDSKVKVIAIEQDSKSIPYDQYKYELPIALIVGHESEGVSTEVLELCDAIVELPMYGINISLNVMVSLGIVLYRVLSEVKKAS
jgi:tRNA G18 (ribose-2'-O)-methylase SpoU